MNARYDPESRTAAYVVLAFLATFSLITAGIKIYRRYAQPEPIQPPPVEYSDETPTGIYIKTHDWYLTNAPEWLTPRQRYHARIRRWEEEQRNKYAAK